MNANNSISSYVRLQLDDSFLDKCFHQLDSKLDRHEEMILELQRLLKNKLDKSDLDQLRELLTKEFNEKLERITDRMGFMEKDLNDKIAALSNRLDSRFSDSLMDLKTSLEKRLSEIEARLPNPNDDNEKIDPNELGEKLMQLENKIQTNSNRTDKHQEFLQTIVSSLGLLNCNTNIPLFESTMANSINNSTIFVNNELAELHKELDKLKDQIQIQNIMNKQKPNQVIITTPQSPPKPIQTAPPPTNEKVVNPSKIIKMKAPDISNINTNISKEFDFSTVKPYGQVTVHWRDPPDLPPIHPFRNMHDFVDYFYQMIPKLQAHLTAIQQKVVENASDILGKVDKSHVEKMFEKFQNMVNELRNRLLDLKDACEQTATREEINEMINDLLLQMNNDGETAIGRVKCIACGRDTGIVTGAKTEYEIQRILGQPPNSIAFRASNNCSTGVSGSAIGVSFSKRDGFDSEIVESPRSIRPFRPKANKMKIPKLPTP